jgi:hypothetical protein
MRPRLLEFAACAPFGHLMGHQLPAVGVENGTPAVADGGHRYQVTLVGL